MYHKEVNERKDFGMKKWIFAMAALMMSSSVFAKTNNGPYLAVRFAGTGLEAELDGIDHSKESNTVFTYGAAFGVRVKDIRAELDWASSSRADYGEYSYLQQRVMLQLYYDIPIRSIIRPFVNVGAGFAYTDFEKRHHSSSYNEDGSSFAWNAGAGLTLAVSRALNVDLGYRYVDAGKKEFYDWPKLKMQAHEGYLGFRYTF